MNLIFTTRSLPRLLCTSTYLLLPPLPLRSINPRGGEISKKKNESKLTFNLKIFSFRPLTICLNKYFPKRLNDVFTSIPNLHALNSQTQNQEFHSTHFHKSF